MAKLSPATTGGRALPLPRVVPGSMLERAMVRPPPRGGGARGRRERGPRRYHRAAPPTEPDPVPPTHPPASAGTDDLLLKVTPPRAPRHLVTRAGLSTGDAEWRRAPLVVVQAPAGFGKT